MTAFVTLMSGKKPTSAPVEIHDDPPPTDLVLRPPQEDGERLQRIAGVIENVVGELAAIDTLKQTLQALRAPIAQEFDAQMKAIAQSAELSHRLSATAARLAETEANHAHTRDQLRERQAKLEQTEVALEAQTAARNVLDQELIELRPALSDANLRAETLGRSVQELETACSNLRIENKSLLDQNQTLNTSNTELAGLVDQLRHDLASTNDQLAEARKRGEALQVRALRAERQVDDLTASLSAERDRAVELEARIQATQAAASRTISDLNAKDDERLVEIATLTNKLSDMQTRCVSLEAAREKTVAEYQGMNAQRTALARDLSARDVELLQLKSRLEGIEASLEDSKRRVADVDSARVAAVQRSDSLSRQLTSVEGRLARAELALTQRSTEADALRLSNDELKAKLTTTTEDLQGMIVQQQSEIDMLRGALAAAQAGKLVFAEAV